MRYSIILGSLLLFFPFTNTILNGQDTSKKPSPARIDSSSTIRTGDSFDSVKYYIKTVPLDTSIDKPMPRYQPDETAFVPVDVKPVPIKQVQPQYPESARLSGKEGVVWLKCLVGKNGKVSKVKVVQSDTPIFDEAAISAALQWKFSPAKIKGKPVEVWAAIPFKFKLDKGK